MQANEEGFDVTTRVLHLGLALFGTAAWWFGEDAGDYRKADHSGYTLHLWLGLIFSAFLALRLAYGFFGPKPQRFPTWMPYTRARLTQAADDLRMLARFKIPDPKSREGLSAAVQGAGILLFTWQAACGTLMSLTLIPGQRATGWLHELKEIHQWAQYWIPTYLILHVGAVVLHGLRGHQIWKKMVFIGK